MATPTERAPGEVPASALGRKALMAGTGLALLAFLVAHLAGNASIFTGGINAYAARLHALPPLVWAGRALLLALLGVHAWLGVALALEARGARPLGYAVQVHRRATIASRTMVWSGLAVGAFLAYHLAHVLLHLLHPEASPAAHADAAGLPDVARMLTAGLGHPVTAAAYLAGIAALGLHLHHGAQSAFQTLGLVRGDGLGRVVAGGRGAALLLALGFASIPAAVIAGLLRVMR